MKKQEDHGVSCSHCTLNLLQYCQCIPTLHQHIPLLFKSVYSRLFPKVIDHSQVLSSLYTQGPPPIKKINLFPPLESGLALSSIKCIKSIILGLLSPGFFRGHIISTLTLGTYLSCKAAQSRPLNDEKTYGEREANKLPASHLPS